MEWGSSEVIQWLMYIVIALIAITAIGFIFVKLT